MTTIRKRLKIGFLPGDSKIFSKYLKTLRILILIKYCGISSMERASNYELEGL